MKITKFVLVFSLIFSLFACGNDSEQKISDLGAKIEKLQKELQKATDPASIDKIQKKLRAIARQKLQEMQNKESDLYDKIKQTKDLESCEKSKAEIEQLNKDIEQHVMDNLIPLREVSAHNFECTNSGYSERMITRVRRFFEQ